MAVFEFSWHKNGCCSFNEFINTERRQMECDYRYGIPNKIFLTQEQILRADTVSDTQRQPGIGKSRLRIIKNQSISVPEGWS